MRITTQMLNESARKAGLPVNNTSLLNYVGGNGSNNSLMEALNQKKGTDNNTVRKSKYERLDKEADNLTQSAETLLQEGEKNLFEQAKASGNNQKVYDGIEKFFEDYNSTLKELRNTSHTMNDFYRQMLIEATAEVKESLAEIGITFAKDGTAKVDREKIKSIDLETLENVFGKESEFVKKVDFLSNRISDYAKANMESFGNAYHADGNLYSVIGNSRYDLWG